MKKWNDIFDETPVNFHNAVEHTLGELEEKEMKKVNKRMPVLVFAVVLVMLAATAFAATNLLGGIVDWNGNYQEASDVIIPTPAPDEDGIDVWNVLHKYLMDIPYGEYWELWHEGSGSGNYGYLNSEFNSMDELADILKETGIKHVKTPEGYKAIDIEVLYRTYYMNKVEYSRETVEYGAELVKYTVEAPDADDIYGYYVMFADEEGSKINVQLDIHKAENYEESPTGDFFVEEGESFELVEDVRFDRGIAIVRTDGANDIRLQKDIADGSIIESYYIYSEADMSVEDLLNKLFE